MPRTGATPGPRGRNADAREKRQKPKGNACAAKAQHGCQRKGRNQNADASAQKKQVAAPQKNQKPKKQKARLAGAKNQTTKKAPAAGGPHITEWRYTS
jgi:hypothetical protein